MKNRIITLYLLFLISILDVVIINKYAHIIPIIGTILSVGDILNRVTLASISGTCIIVNNDNSIDTITNNSINIFVLSLSFLFLFSIKYIIDITIGIGNREYTPAASHGLW